LHYVVSDYPVRLIGLDTTVPGETGGAICASRLTWLEARLAEARHEPTIIFMHHPPFTTAIGYMDKIGLENSGPLAALVARYPRVERVLCGHLHRPIQVRWAGTIAATAPAPAHQMVLALTPGAPARWRMEPPAVLLHLWRPDVGIISHTSYINDFGPERAFSESGATDF
jgi:3',5'-cyclic AMP phosphodiesterase CpdA